MDKTAFDAAKQAYKSGDMAFAVTALEAARLPGESNGEADHLRGNALMKLGRYAEAAEAYGAALSDASYGKVGALNCNRGRAFVAAGRPDQAVACFQAAVADPSYATPYKAQLALGNLYSSQGKVREAGTAYRAAAIDEANPDPAAALSKLGSCFMELSRPVDAVEAYRTALDFSSDPASSAAIYGALGNAYVAANRMAEALDCFGRATSDGTYELKPEERVSYEAAQKAVAAVSGAKPSETDALLAATGYDETGTGSFDPLDPMGKSAEFMPSPEETGFFSVTEQDLEQAERKGKKDRKVQRKHKHRGLKVFLTLLVLLVIVGGVAGFGYYKGYGWPMAESVTTDLFAAKANGSDVDGFLANSVDATTKAEIEAILPAGGSATVRGVTRSMTSSEVLVTATLPQGGTQDYVVELSRDGLGWKVTSAKLSYASVTDDTQQPTATTRESLTPAGVEATTGTLPTTGA